MAIEKFRVEGLAGVLKTLEQLPPEIVSKAGGPVKLGLKKAMTVMGEQVKQNLQGIIDSPNVGGENESTGLLMQNIRVARGRVKGQNGEAFRVYVRKKVYPQKPVETQPREGSNPKRVSTPQVARLLEYGTAKRPPMPFLRPAFDAKKTEAVDIFTAELRRRIGAIQKKLARANRVPA